MNKIFLVVALLITSISFAQQSNTQQAPGNSSGGGGDTPSGWCSMTGFPITRIQACVQKDGVLIKWKEIPLGAVFGYDVFECDTNNSIQMATRIAFTKNGSYLITSPRLNENTRYCVVPVSHEYCKHYKISAPIAPVDCGAP